MAGAAPPALLAASAPVAALPDGSSPHRPARREPRALSTGAAPGPVAAAGTAAGGAMRGGEEEEEGGAGGAAASAAAPSGAQDSSRCRPTAAGRGGAAPHPPLSRIFRLSPAVTGRGRGEGAAGEAAPPHGLPRSAGPLPKRRGAPQPRGGRCRPGAQLWARGGLQLLPARPSLRNPT